MWCYTIGLEWNAGKGSNSRSLGAKYSNPTHLLSSYHDYWKCIQEIYKPWLLCWVQIEYVQISIEKYMLLKWGIHCMSMYGQLINLDWMCWYAIPKFDSILNMYGRQSTSIHIIWRYLKWYSKIWMHFENAWGYSKSILKIFVYDSRFEHTLSTHG